jgi:chemotaxis protein MotB
MARKAQAAHHGGAWKVAYADFVTAMMALFMVLWISSQDQKILIATSKYFQNPFRSERDATSGSLPFSNSKKGERIGGEQAAEKNPAKKRTVELTFLNTVAAEVYRMLRIDSDFTNKAIDVQITSDGLRITLFDRPTKPLFVGNTAEFTDWGKFVTQNLSWMIDRHHFRVTIDGHTKAKLVLERPEYSPWELSADRANATRRNLVFYAVDPALIDRITGYSDTRPLDGELPEAEANQRITLSLSLTGGKIKEQPARPAPAVSDAPQPTVPGPS